MQNQVIILPGLLAREGDESISGKNMPTLAALTQQSILTRLHPLGRSGLLEAAWLGLNPESIFMADGPLAVAAFKVDPPAASVHYRLSILSYDDVVSEVGQDFSEKDVREVLRQANRLETSDMKIVAGEGLDHGLVIEKGSVDLVTSSPAAIVGKPLHGFLPEGDDDRKLRRLIDDSLDLLGGFELNRRRVDEGRRALNLLWPWGQGFREYVPNLALSRGSAVAVKSRSLRLAGLTRLAGDQHGPITELGPDMRPNWSVLTGLTTDSIAVLDSFARFRNAYQLEEAECLASELDRNFLGKLDPEKPWQLLLVAPSLTEFGLAALIENRSSQSNIYPFDERSRTESNLPIIQTWERISDFLTGSQTLV